jgi:hypothetical protein
MNDSAWIGGEAIFGALQGILGIALEKIKNNYYF